MVWHENSNFLVLKNQINLTKMLFNKVSNIFGTKIQIQKNRISGQKQDNYSSVQFSGSCHWRDFFSFFGGWKKSGWLVVLVSFWDGFNMMMSSRCYSIEGLELCYSCQGAWKSILKRRSWFYHNRAVVNSVAMFLFSK